MSMVTPAEAFVREFEARDVSGHALFSRLRARPVDPGALWLLMANLQSGVSRSFVVWLARTIEAIDDPRIASLIAKQLNDELGNGQFDEIHSALLQRFVRALERWRPVEADDTTLEPGRRMHAAEDALFGSEPYARVGALVSGEIFANKMDRCVGDEIRRDNAIEASALRWLELHETLEAYHASDSLELARLVPPGGPAFAAMTRGAQRHWEILWRFLDEVHEQLLRVESRLTATSRAS
jgi:pyrroloquinoline quinone (PQQ) biosynthesis protein C